MEEQRNDVFWQSVPRGYNWEDECSLQFTSFLFVKRLPWEVVVLRS
jgi:hypothetical protein